jgi:hypothetical protein
MIFFFSFVFFNPKPSENDANIDKREEEFYNLFIG